MKVFYTTDRTFDENLEQVCPFHDKDSGKSPIYVGSLACANCPYCYGSGFNTAPYGIIPLKNMALIPKYRRDKDINEKLSSYINYEKSEQEKIELGQKQFFSISDLDYILCSRFFSEKHQKSLEIRYKTWFYHNITVYVEKAIKKIREKILDIKVKIKYSIYYEKYKKDIV